MDIFKLHLRGLLMSISIETRATRPFETSSKFASTWITLPIGPRSFWRISHQIPEEVVGDEPTAGLIWGFPWQGRNCVPSLWGIDFIADKPLLPVKNPIIIKRITKYNNAITVSMSTMLTWPLTFHSITDFVML